MPQRLPGLFRVALFGKKFFFFFFPVASRTQALVFKQEKEKETVREGSLNKHLVIMHSHSGDYHMNL